LYRRTVPETPIESGSASVPVLPGVLIPFQLSTPSRMPA
jgi:hypothetical protein